MDWDSDCCKRKMFSVLISFIICLNNHNSDKAMLHATIVDMQHTYIQPIPNLTKQVIYLIPNYSKKLINYG